MCYDMFDVAFSLCFVRARGFVWIVSNEQTDQGWTLPVPEAEFFSGAQRFLRDFAIELSRRVPGILYVPGGDPLRPYAIEAAG